jgi:hypothetical protein
MDDWELSQGAGVDMIAPGWLKYRGLNEKALWREMGRQWQTPEHREKA